MKQEKRNFNNCLAGEPPFCSVACPFHLDVRDFIGKIQRGGFNAAFRKYQETVGFPGIVTNLCNEPCKNVCIRQKKDEAISMRLLEKSSMDYATRINPNSYNMPSKNKKIAIIGAGISGLACALRLCMKKYDVSIFEKDNRIGGHLWQVLPPELFLSDIERQFMHEKYKLYLNTEITSLNDLDDLNFDAIYIATGKGGTDFELLHEVVKFASLRPGVFLGGSLLGRNSIEAIANGLDVSKDIEYFIKTGSMKTSEEKFETNLFLDPEQLTPTRQVFPSNGNAYTKDEALLEAKRCIKCTCDACIRYCDLMKNFRKTPKMIAEEVEATINPGTLAGDGTIATRFISTCNQCGLCKEVCPQDIDVGELLLHSRRIMHDKGAMPWVFHDFWLRDMEFTNGPDAHLSRVPLGYSQSRYMFFPGCQLGASDPRYVTESYRWLLEKEPDTALNLSCCGAPAQWAGNDNIHKKAIAKIYSQWISLGQPTAVFACPTCKQMFMNYLPNIKGVFLYDLCLQWGGFPSNNKKKETASVFDPCASRHEPDLQQTIRKLAKQFGFKLVPLPQERKFAQCCSWGGQVSIANPNYTHEVIKTRVTQNDKPYITYCINCRDIFSSAQKQAYHILDLLFGLNDSSRVTPTVSERRINRIILKHQVSKEFWKDEVEMVQMKSKINLNIVPELKQKLNKEMILETDIEDVIEYCESSGRKVLDSETRHCIGYLKIGKMTYWAEYLPVENGFKLINAYSHRMSIEED